MEDRPWTRVSAHGICVANDSILLVRLAPPLAEAGRWGLPGGGLDWGETPADALVREVREETGLHAETEAVVGVYSDTYMQTPERPEPSVHFISVVYRVRVVGGGDLVHELRGTTDHAAWVGLSEVSDLPLGALASYGLSLLVPPLDSEPTHDPVRTGRA